MTITLMAFMRWTAAHGFLRWAGFAWPLALPQFPPPVADAYCVVDGWGTGEGLLPQSSIISMTQTRDGYLWLGTRNGLVRFDGVHFTVFDESTTPELSSIQTVRLFEDSQSNLWIGTESAGVMLVSNGRIRSIPRRQGHVVSICEDSIGAVWMLTRGSKPGALFHGQCGRLENRRGRHKNFWPLGHRREVRPGLGGDRSRK